VHVRQRCSIYDGRTVLMSRRFERLLLPSTEPDNNTSNKL
jgi:hypothetical protein